MTEAPHNDTPALADEARRRFLKRAGLTAGFSLFAGSALAAGLPKALDEATSSERRWGILVDAGKCPEGCTACVDACFEEMGIEGPRVGDNHSRPDQDSQWIRKVSLKNEDTGHALALPVMCQHCTYPPCVDVCPTGASFKRADGIVLVDRHVCIGCRYCIMACPYKARCFVHEAIHDQEPYMPRGKGTAEGCTMCVHRIDHGMKPACVVACHEEGAGAMTFGDTNDPESAIAGKLRDNTTSAIRADLGTEPGIRYMGI